MSDIVKRIAETYRMIEDLGEDLKLLFAELDKEMKEKMEHSMEHSEEYIQLEWEDEPIF